MLKTLTGLSLAVALSIGAGARATADPDVTPNGPTLPTPTQGVDVARGDEWIYQVEDSLTGAALSNFDVVVVDKQPTEIDVRIRVTDPNTGAARVGAATFDAFWRREPDGVGLGRGVQDSWGVRPKLKVGDDWDYNFERPLSGGPIMMSWIGHGEALGVERMDLPNGRTVDTVKVEFFERPSVARYHFEMRVVEWFSPEINRYVRREIETRVEGKISEATTEILQDYIKRR